MWHLSWLGSVKYFPVSIIRLMLLKSLRMRKTAYIVNKECNKSLKIPKGKSESVNRWRTEKNGQQKKEKRTNNIYKHTYKTKDRVTQTPLKTGDELMCSRRVSSFCSTSGTRRVNLVTNPVISHDLTRTWMRMKITVLYLRSILPSVINCDLTVANIISTIYADRPCNAKSHVLIFWWELLSSVIQICPSSL